VEVEVEVDVDVDVDVVARVRGGREAGRRRSWRC